MAKKRSEEKMNTTEPAKMAKPVRLDLKPADHDRLERQASKRGLSMASFVRMIVLERLDALESEGR
jgi:hypothetical protein